MDTVFHWMDDRLAVGAPYGDNGVSGWLTLGRFMFSNELGRLGPWSRKYRTKSSGLITALLSRDYFGYSVSLDDDRLAVGASGDRWCIVVVQHWSGLCFQTNWDDLDIGARDIRSKVLGLTALLSG